MHLTLVGDISNTKRILLLALQIANILQLSHLQSLQIKHLKITNDSNLERWPSKSFLMKVSSRNEGKRRVSFWFGFLPGSEFS